MSDEKSYHRLLARQIKKAKRNQAEGQINIDLLLEQISLSFEENDKVAERSARSLQLMSDELRDANEKLAQENEDISERFSFAVSGANDGIWDWNLETNEVYFSPRWETMIGYEVGELTPHYDTYVGLLHPDDVPTVKKQVKIALAKDGGHYKVRFRLKTKEGGWNWVLSRGQVVKYDSNNKPLRMVGTHVDIQEQVMYQSSLQQLIAISTSQDTALEEKIHQMLELGQAYIGMQLGIVCQFKDNTHEIMYIASEDDFGIDPTIELEPFCCSLESDHDESSSIVKLYDMEKDNHPLYKKYGFKSYIAAQLLSSLDMQGAVCFLSTQAKTEFTQLQSQYLLVLTQWIAFEIERESKEQALMEEKERAESGNKAKSEFLATMSHEIRTPLNGILGIVDVVLDTELTENQKEKLIILRHSSITLLTIINDILDFSKIEAGKLDICLEPFELSGMLEATHNLYSDNASVKGIIFEVEKEKDLPLFTKSDESRIRQILNNLISNAIKFTHEGRVKLHVSHEMKNEKEAIYHFVITDTGIGMTDEQISRLFQKFSQADGTTTRKYGGTGLGLAISKQLAELLDGTITVTSVQGEGSKFHVELPLTLCEEKEVKKHIGGDLEISELTTQNGKVPSVLLVEDNKVNQMVAKNLLKKVKCDVTTAENGQEAVDHCKAGEFDVILMDMQMPVMDGLTATTTIREFNRKTPIIALTANAMKGDKEKCLDAGMNDYLSKPIQKELLIKMLHFFLTKHTN